MPDTLWISLPRTTFLMGSQQTQAGGPGFDPDGFPHEGPPRWQTVEAFAMARTPVTVAMFQEFVQGGGYQRQDLWACGGFGQFSEPLAWGGQLAHPDHPVVGVSWFEAMAYAHAQEATLPTEAQWECAARGPEGRRFPWGDAPPTSQHLNALESGHGGPTPVLAHPLGQTPEGVFDLAGNVWEWCESVYQGPHSHCEADLGVSRVFRGGCFAGRAIFARAAMRAHGQPHQRFDRRGFRLARGAPVAR